MRRSTTRARQGDYLVVDDRTGFTHWRSECVREWNGLIVHRDQFEARHPQDTLRVPREDMRVPDARPARRIEDETFVGPLITEIAEDQPGDNNQYAPMGSLGLFALGQTDEGDEASAPSNSAGAFSITVASTSRMAATHRIGVLLDSGDLFQTQIEYVTSPTTLLLSAMLPANASAGNKVFDYTASTSTTL